MEKIKKVEYEVHSDYGCSLFENEKDAISALELLGNYHGMSVNRKAVKDSLDNHYFYDAYPLAVSKIVYS